MLIPAIVTLHILVCLGLCIIILLQQGKGAEVGAVFGGSSQTVFGSSGAGNMLTKLTWAMATVFFATSIFLAYASARRATGSIFGGSGSVMQKKMAPLAPPMPVGAVTPNVSKPQPTK